MNNQYCSDCGSEKCGIIESWHGKLRFTKMWCDGCGFSKTLTYLKED